MNDSDLQSELELYDGPDDPSQIAAGLVLFLGFPLPFIKFACPEYLPISLYINPKHLLRFPPRPQHHLQTYQRNRYRRRNRRPRFRVARAACMMICLDISLWFFN